MTAVYWQGGDEGIERTLYRPQYFDKIVAWGGGPAIDNVIKYLGPGIQLVSFDPKSSISMIGREAFASAETMDDVAERLALDTTVFNQEACLASRFVFVEGERLEIETFCAKLVDRLGVDRDYASAMAQPLPLDVREEVEVMSAMGDLKTFGSFDGCGSVILSDTPGISTRRTRRRTSSWSTLLTTRSATSTWLPRPSACIRTNARPNYGTAWPQPVHSGCAAWEPPTHMPWVASPTQCIRCSGLFTGWPTTTSTCD